MYPVKELRFQGDDLVSVTLFKANSSGDSMDVNPDLAQAKAIMQFTGLFDKNGNEIYESDRVRLYRKGAFVTAVIIFENGIFCLAYDDGYKNLYPLNPENYEVIGNALSGL